MKSKITSDWDKLAFNGAIKKGRKGGKFVSRLTGRTVTGERPSTAGKVRGLAFTEPCKLEKGPEYEIKESKGIFYYQPRIGGKFGKRMEISESLAMKLGI